MERERGLIVFGGGPTPVVQADEVAARCLGAPVPWLLRRDRPRGVVIAPSGLPNDPVPATLSAPVGCAIPGVYGVRWPGLEGGVAWCHILTVRTEIVGGPGTAVGLVGPADALETAGGLCRTCRSAPAADEGLCVACAVRALRAARRYDRTMGLLSAGLAVPGTVPAPGTDRLLTAAEVAVKLRVDKSTVYRLIRSGLLRAVRIGRRSLVPAGRLERFLIEHRTRRIP